MLSETIEACLGYRECDLVLEGPVFNPYTQKIEYERLGVYRGKFVGFSKDLMGKMLEFDGILIPGLIDAHIHIESSMLIPREFARVVLPRGTSTVVCDPHEIANVLGKEGINFMIDDSKATPLNFYFLAPSCVPSSNLETSGAKIDSKDIEEILELKEIIGLGEVMNFPAVIEREPEILRKIGIPKEKIIEGHCPGLKGKELNAYLSTGIISDHECSDKDEAIEKLKRGIYLMIREGTASKNLHDLAEVIKEVCGRRCILVSDDRDPIDLKREGHVDHLVRRAIEEGIDPEIAVTLVTLNPSEYLRLKIFSPGSNADFVIVDSLDDFNVMFNIVNGEVVSEKGILKIDIPEYKGIHKDTMNLGEISSKDFLLRTDKENTRVKVIEIVEGQIFTRKRVFPMEGKELSSDTERDILKIAVVERHKNSGRISKGFVHGFNLKKGAIASSISHDSHNIIAVGVEDDSIAKAVNEVKRMKGGISCVLEGKTISLALPVGGLMSNRPVEYVSSNLEKINETIRNMGCNLRNPVMTLSFLALPVIPELKITDYGLVENFKVVDLEESDE